MSQKLEFVREQNRVYRALLDRHSPHWRLQDAERKVLAEEVKPPGKLLSEVITIMQPVLSESSNEDQIIGIAVLVSLPHRAIADKILVFRAG